MLILAGTESLFHYRIIQSKTQLNYVLSQTQVVVNYIEKSFYCQTEVFVGIRASFFYKFADIRIIR